MFVTKKCLLKIILQQILLVVNEVFGSVCAFSIRKWMENSELHWCWKPCCRPRQLVELATPKRHDQRRLAENPYYSDDSDHGYANRSVPLAFRQTRAWKFECRFRLSRCPCDRWCTDVDCCCWPIPSANPELLRFPASLGYYKISGYVVWGPIHGPGNIFAPLPNFQLVRRPRTDTHVEQGPKWNTFLKRTYWKWDASNIQSECIGFCFEWAGRISSMDRTPLEFYFRHDSKCRSGIQWLWTPGWVNWHNKLMLCWTR